MEIKKEEYIKIRMTKDEAENLFLSLTDTQEKILSLDELTTSTPECFEEFTKLLSENIYR